ncbi:TPA: DUF2591 family protein [Pseudomonas aeruginosa]|nr:DUF2591 family protein [Pseudomonas aeruginosa]
MSETVEVKTCDLEGTALDWAVAVIEGYDLMKHPFRRAFIPNLGYCDYSPSTNWTFGGPLIEKHMVRTHYAADTEKRADAGCIAQTWRPYAEAYGRTLLIAACRAIVTARLGETINVPAELIK